MPPGFSAEWLALREPFDDAALDRSILAEIQACVRSFSSNRDLIVLDLGSGTGAALRRAAGWLAGRSWRGYAVERDPDLLACATVSDRAGRPPGVVISPLLADVLQPLVDAGGPGEGSVDLLLGHALADLLPLDALAARTVALLRPGGLAHFALSYDGETVFSPEPEPDLAAEVMSAYHAHMDRLRAVDASYGGSTAGRRLVTEAGSAGLDILRSAPAYWEIWIERDRGRQAASCLINQMLDFVERSSLEMGLWPADVRRWTASHRRAVRDGSARLRVRHLDLLARRPPSGGPS